MEKMLRPTQRRGDGAATRSQLLEAAGQVIAEKGVDRATGKEIAERAGSNSAAINYYFGGMEGLYEDVLVEAHRRFASYDDIAAVANEDVPAGEKLRRLLAIGVRSVVEQGDAGWAMRVLSREFLSPSPARQMLEDRELLPKKKLVVGIVAESLGRSEDDPVVERCCFSILAPITMLVVCEPHSRREAFPGLGDDRSGAAALAEHLHAFAMGGLAAVGAADQPHR